MIAAAAKTRRAVLALTVPILVAMALGATIAAGPAPAQSDQSDQAFLSQVPDVPLAPGLAELENSGLSFDKPEGRIVVAEAAGAADAEAVRRFYAQTLPQLGWRASGPASYRREGETLTLTFAERGAKLHVGFMLEPRD